MSSEQKVTRDQISVARVLSEDDQFLILEVPKSDQERFTLQQGDRFLTLIFVVSDDKGGMRAWKPWGESHD